MCSVVAVFLWFRSTKDNGWLLSKLCNCGAVGVVFLLSCELSYAFGVVESFCCVHLFERVEESC